MITFTDIDQRVKTSARYVHSWFDDQPIHFLCAFAHGLFCLCETQKLLSRCFFFPTNRPVLNRLSRARLANQKKLNSRPFATLDEIARGQRSNDLADDAGLFFKLSQGRYLRSFPGIDMPLR